ncbi:hypothetical protein [Sphingobium ummariense]|uniref:Uncharacterized protein n=1 Tax=Sphingobium ummariense RL-3 TaxID=1346791 RepID=T0J1X9_9SPHN|nr:hypothetical protein [Sphingobium ummariense]EQB31971.1 hypothetical protein M529_11960 [Sphingobium ummariense RL-3]
MTEPSFDLATVMATYGGSDGKRTLALFEELQARGPIGIVALNLFRACKNSERAKTYRGGIRGRGSYRSMAYDRKGWAIDNLCSVLAEHAEALEIAWGWGVDCDTTGFNQVLYVEIATGQVSFHSPRRGAGPDYAGEWDGVRGQASTRICCFVADILKFAPEVALG